MIPGICRLGRIANDLVAIGIEAHAPEANVAHELLGMVELAIAAEDCVDELDAAVFAHGDAATLRLALGRLPHGLLAGLEQFLEANPEALTGLEEVLDKFAMLLVADVVDGLVGALDLASQLDEEKPEVASNVGHGLTGTVGIDGPVVDPLAQAIGIEDATEQQNWLLGSVPMLGRIAGGDARLARILFSGLAPLALRRRLWLWRSSRRSGCI
jgi:hypothetical protein